MPTVPEKIWGAFLNRNGLLHKTPERYTWSNGKWWHKNGNQDIEGIGFDLTEFCVTFSSTNRKDVVTWISGVRAAMSMLREFTDSGYKVSPYPQHLTNAGG